MTLASNRSTKELKILGDAVSPLSLPVAAAAVLYAGALGCFNADGDAVPGSANTALTAAGRVESKADNSTGAAGAIRASIKPGVFLFGNSGDSIAESDRGSTCYVVDDESVALTDGGGTRPVAGTIVGVDAASGDVWVAVGFSFFSVPAATPSGTLQKKTVTIGQADLTDAVNGEAETEAIGTALPAGAIVVAAVITLTTAFSGGGAASVTVDVGWSGSAEAVIKDFDALGSTAAGAKYTQGATSVHHPVTASAKSLIATFTPDGGANLAALTAGAMTIDVFYFVAF
jgi:hypothetical protein